LFTTGQPITVTFSSYHQQPHLNLPHPHSIHPIHRVELMTPCPSYPWSSRVLSSTPTLTINCALACLSVHSLHLTAPSGYKGCHSPTPQLCPQVDICQPSPQATQPCCCHLVHLPDTLAQTNSESVAQCNLMPGRLLTNTRKAPMQLCPSCGLWLPCGHHFSSIMLPAVGRAGEAVAVTLASKGLEGGCPGCPLGQVGRPAIQ